MSVGNGARLYTLATHDCASKCLFGVREAVRIQPSVERRWDWSMLHLSDAGYDDFALVSFHNDILSTSSDSAFA